MRDKYEKLADLTIPISELLPGLKEGDTFLTPRDGIIVQRSERVSMHVLSDGTCIYRELLPDGYVQISTCKDTAPAGWLA